MKRLIFGLIGTAVVAAMVLFACNKSQVENVEISAMEEQALINPANPDNPFDYYGDLHNKGLRIALDELKDSPDASFDEMISVSFQAAQKVISEDGLMIQKSTINWEEDEEFIAMMQLLIEDMEHNYVNFVASLNLDTYTKNKLQILFEDVIAMSEIEELTYDDVFDKVIEFETKIINKAVTISNDDREAVFACTSTLRYSLDFWLNELDFMSESESYSFLKAKPRKKWYHWLIIGVADAAGGLGGYALGGGAGAIPAGTGCSTLANTLIKDHLEGL